VRGEQSSPKQHLFLMYGVRLASKQIKFRRGQVCMVAAAPNAGKSMFALIYSVKAKVPTLVLFGRYRYHNRNDKRAAAHSSGHNQVTVEQNLSNNCALLRQTL
jgi:hypothetical protein